MKSTVFEYAHYRDYLKVRLSTKGENRGMRTKLAEATRTQPAFISRVLGGQNDLSLEHIPPTNELLGHSREEAHFFSLLVMHARAGTPALKEYFKAQISELLTKRADFMQRVNVQESVPPLDQGFYYGKWLHQAIHMLVNLPDFRTREAIAERLNLPLDVTSEGVESLLKMGLIENKGGKLVIGKKRIHIDKRSPWVTQLHSNFRLHAIEKLVAPEDKDFHFSLGMTMSKELFVEYRKRMVELVGEFEEKMKEDYPDDFYTLNIDLFRS